MTAALIGTSVVTEEFAAYAAAHGLPAATQHLLSNLSYEIQEEVGNDCVVPRLSSERRRRQLVRWRMPDGRWFRRAFDVDGSFGWEVAAALLPDRAVITEFGYAIEITIAGRTVRVKKTFREAFSAARSIWKAIDREKREAHQRRRHPGRYRRRQLRKAKGLRIRIHALGDRLNELADA